MAWPIRAQEKEMPEGRLHKDEPFRQKQPMVKGSKDSGLFLLAAGVDF